MKRFIPILLLMASSAALSAQAEPEELRIHRVGFTLGLATSFGNDGGSESFDNLNYELNYRFLVERDTLVGIRAGQMNFDNGVGARSQGDISYVTVAGEYLINEGYYESGLFLGLGFYGINGDPATAQDSANAVGLTAGVTGDFKVAPAAAVLVQLVVHWTGLSDVDFIASLSAGMSFHF